MLSIFTVQWQRSMHTGAIISTETSSVWVFYCLHSEKELIKIQHDQPNSVLSANAFPSNLYKGKLYIKTGSVVCVQSLTGISPWISNSIYSLYIIHLLIHGPLIPMLTKLHPVYKCGPKPSGPRLNIKTVFPRYGDSHVKDKTVVRPSYPLGWRALKTPTSQTPGFWGHVTPLTLHYLWPRPPGVWLGGPGCKPAHSRRP